MISVIMLTYNRERFIRNMIEDIQNQTYTDYEFIIIDNGSTDSSGQIAEEYAKNDSRIKVIHINEPRSIGYARNVGIANANGEYIAFVDDDDRVHESYLEFLLNLLESNCADISICGCSEIDEEKQEKKPQCVFDEKIVISGEEVVKYLLDRQLIRSGIPCKLYKSYIMKKYPFVENYKNEDIHTQYKYLLESKTIAMHGKDLYFITRHDGNVSNFTSDASKWNRDIMLGYLDAYKNRTAFVKEKAPGIYEDALYSEWSFMISMINKINQYDLEDCRELEKQMKCELQQNREIFFKMSKIKDFEIEWMERYIK